jgi:hypothetical protein
LAKGCLISGGVIERANDFYVTGVLEREDEVTSPELRMNPPIDEGGTELTSDSLDDIDD